MSASIPSSPPSLPDDAFDGFPSSPPPLPPLNPRPVSRKRVADHDTSSSLSSDPLFSEDASEESEVGGTRKKRYRRGGPYYDDLRRAAWNKDKDSGVWMGSDSSTDSLGGNNRGMQSLSFREYSKKRAPPVAKKEATPADVAAGLVLKAVDACADRIDLSDMCLREIPNDVLQPLHQLIRLPVDVHSSQKITPHHFAPLTPDIKLFLSRNGLRTLPTELWNLTNITVLSLRNNELTELPPSVARLRKLQELNIAGNQIEYLPWELLALMRSDPGRKFIFSPNPFVQPLGHALGAKLNHRSIPNTLRDSVRALRLLQMHWGSPSMRSEPVYKLMGRLYEMRIQCAMREAEPDSALDATAPPDLRPVYVASSKPTFFSLDGSDFRSPTTSFSSQSAPDHSVSYEPLQVPRAHVSKAPSLFELSARDCARSPYVSQLPDLLPDEASPPVIKAVAKAMESTKLGLRKCSVCDKPYLIARAEWIDYWSTPAEDFLPFQRQACSWACVSELWTQRDQLQEECAGSVERAMEILGPNEMNAS